MWVRSTPSGPGLQTANLVVRDAAGHAYTVPLQGWTYGGTTRLMMNSDPGDWVGGGQQHSYDPSNAIFDAGGTREGVSFSVSTDQWDGDFVPSRGDILTTGSTWTGAQRYPFQGSSPGMDVSGEGHGCNTVTGQFTVREVTYNPDGSLRTLGVQFEQHCEGGQPALRGELDWRMGDHTPPAPWMNASSGSSPPTGDGSTSGSGAGTSAGSTATGSGSGPQVTATSPSGSPAKSPAASSSGQKAAVGTVQALIQTLARLRADAARVDRALVRLRHHPANPGQRRAATTALTRLRQDVTAMARVLQRVRPSGGAPLARWRRMESAISAWRQALTGEQRSMSRQALVARTVKLDALARARGATALKDLVSFARTG